MKCAIGIVMFAALCAGCASDRGVYSVKLNVDDYKCDPVTKDLIPKFRIDAKKQEIADQGRSTLVGKWRVVINTDFASTGLGGGGRVWGQWEINVYEFNDDGTYSMRRVAEDKKTMLENSGEDGLWSYGDGVLRLQPKCMLCPGAFPFSGAKRYECDGLTQGDECRALNEFRVKWHSNSAFTLEYADLAKVKACYEIRDSRVSKAMGVKSYSTSGIHYDKNGCLHEQSYCNDGQLNMLTCSVTNSKLFKRLENR